MRLYYNYTKENLYQILPLLFLIDNNQIIILLGFAKKNIAFVFGKNLIEKKVIGEYKIITELVEESELSNAKKVKVKIDSKQAINIAIIFGAVAAPILLYRLVNKKR